MWQHDEENGVKVFVTGAGGFVGPYLIRHIQSLNPDTEIHGSVYTQPENPIEHVRYTQLDLMDYEQVLSVLGNVKPDLIYHLAAQSSPGKALKAVWQTVEMNVRMQLNLLQACVDLNIKPRILIMSSGDIYAGGATNPDVMPVNEDAPLMPGNPYALSKVTQDMMGVQYYLSCQLPIIRVRPFNHTGPHQREAFVAPDFAMQIAKIEANLQEPLMRVGNLAAERDFTDVRDIVRAYVLLADKGEPGVAYNVSSNKTYSIQSLLDTLLRYTDAEITVETDPARFRPVDVPVVQGDNSRLVELTGWQPAIGFEQTLHDLLDDCRERVQKIMRSST